MFNSRKKERELIKMLNDEYCFMMAGLRTMTSHMDCILNGDTTHTKEYHMERINSGKTLFELCEKNVHEIIEELGRL